MWGTLLRKLSLLFSSKWGRWLASALAFIGIGLATYKGTNLTLDYVKSNFDGLSGDALQWVGFLNFDKALTMIFSAYGARAAYNATKVRIVKHWT